MKLLANKKVLAVVVVLGLVASLLVWTLSRGDELGEMRVQADKGTVEIERDGTSIRVGGQNPVEPGDIVSTGTPAGVGSVRKPRVWLKPGDEIVVESPTLGALRTTIA